MYYKIDHSGEGKYTEKMSRFLGFAMEVNSAEEAKEKVKEYQNRYCDSRHVCWAYMLGPEKTEWQLNDNGEPSGTAGKPILGQIRSHDVTDVLVIVVRYFGGIKLGTSGLISAYKEAARLALEDAGRKEMHEMQELHIEVPYISADGVMRIIKETPEIEVMERDFGNVITLRIKVRKADMEEIAGRMGKTEGITIKVTDS
ncbi:MAG: YigZ family protein [Muribaculaceae bacterium]|nr:YigZ family protein [Muribaculaceae bacterium]MDE6559230.1 YigZ family protein [Muribaculaceae bacterium]